MNKKIIIPIFIIIVIGFIGFIFWSNMTISTITLDINPSIEINLKRNNKVKSVVALNDDAKAIISNNLSGKSLENTLKIITNKVIEKGYAPEGYINILIYTKDSALSENVSNELSKNFGMKHIGTDIIIVKEVTKEDEMLAQKYNITPAKASYINTVTKEIENITVEDLVSKPIRELKETKQTGRYCEKEYLLEGNFCLKEQSRVAASNGKVCPQEYYEYNDTCYKEVGVIDTDKLECFDDFTLEGTKCTRNVSTEAEPVKYSCSQGEAKTRLELGLSSPNDGDAKNVVCVDYSSATHPVTPCELPADDPTERMSSGGKCYWHRAPVIAEGCPGKIQVAGECWDDASSIYICAGYRDGKQYSSKDEYCEHSIKYLDPIVTEYKCPSNNYTLSGSICKAIEVQDARHERVCPSGYTKTENDRCINLNETIAKEDGLVCNMENSKLKGNECIIYEIIEAKHN